MDRQDKRYGQYIAILSEELRPAMGCTEPISLAYGAARAREVLGCMPDRVDVAVSGNIIKNVKSVIVPNTNGMKGIGAAVAAGIVAGDASLVLEVLSHVTAQEKEQMRVFLETCPIAIRPTEGGPLFDINLTLYHGEDSVFLRIVDYHTNITLIERNGERVFEAAADEGEKKSGLTDRSVLDVADIYDFANTVDLDDVRALLEEQVRCNTAIAQEGLHNDWGAHIGRTLLARRGDDVRVRARAYAAAGSDARMSGCELPVTICSGSGNQGITASMPVVVYAEHLGKSRDEMLRALLLSDLLTIHQKTPIGRLSAFCGAVSAGCAAGAAIAYMQGAGLEGVSATLSNALAIVNGITCDGAKPSCAAKISAAVDAGLMGYDMYLSGANFCDGDGILGDDVEKTIDNVGRVARLGMRETDREILKIMTE